MRLRQITPMTKTKRFAAGAASSSTAAMKVAIGLAKSLSVAAAQVLAV
jgi:hypothetical protein